jgi:hypothetical protein
VVQTTEELALLVVQVAVVVLKEVLLVQETPQVHLQVKVIMVVMVGHNLTEITQLVVAVVLVLLVVMEYQLLQVQEVMG